MSPSSCTSVEPLSSTYIGTSMKGVKGGPSCVSIGSSPHLTCWPKSSIWTSQGRTPYSSISLDRRSHQSQKSCFSSAVILSSIGNCHSSGSLKTLNPAFVVLKLLLGIPSTVAYVNLLEEEIVWKGVARGGIGPVKATVLGAAVCLPPHLQYPPKQFQATMAWAPLPVYPPGLPQRRVFWPAQASYMPRWVIR